MGVYGQNLRDITFACTSAGVLTYEAVEVAIAKVREIEEKYAINPASVTDITAAKVVLTGKTPYKIFVFTATIVKATGAYTFVLDEIAPNIEIATTV